MLDMLDEQIYVSPSCFEASSHRMTIFNLRKRQRGISHRTHTRSSRGATGALIKSDTSIILSASLRESLAVYGCLRGAHRPTSSSKGIDPFLQT